MKTIIFYTNFYQNIHQNASFVAYFLTKLIILHSKRACKIISFYMKMVIFENILRKNQIKIYTKTHNFSKFSQRSISLNLFAMQYIHYGKIICTPLLNPVMHAHLSLLEYKQICVIKGPLFQF